MMGMYAMRRILGLCLTVILGLTSVNSASAGFIAGANTNVALLKSNYNNSVSFVNKFVTIPGTLVTGAGLESGPASAYSHLLPFYAPGYNVYLYSPKALTGTGVTFTDGEQVAAVVASNGILGLSNVWASHLGLQPDVLAALQGFYGNNATVAAAVIGVFTNGSNAVEIIGGTPDSMSATLTSVNGTYNSVDFGGINGLNELSLIITTVPEPTSLGLFGIGTLVVGLVRSRRKKS
jgi:PEP-CTERM motif